MKTSITIFVLAGLFFAAPTPTKPVTAKRVPIEVKKLMACYPDFVVGFADNHILLKDKARLLWDDGVKDKPFQQLLDEPDIKDMFGQKYEKGAMASPPTKNSDPGRIRNEAFFLKMYGQTEAAVRGNLTEITWCPKLVGQKIMVTKINGIDKKFTEISNELDEHPELKQYLVNIAGTFAWRNISGTNRHSTHSFGMTMDINTDYTNYWQWDCKCKNEDADVTYRNRIPQIIVDIFEKHGFIWGGKWYHYDTMHFEYRPELLN
ncbi:M15 family metallopeptidase [uncultured Mucilaginibacter sp.]|uniref:M15 family metallopeptidase n=1 Tax=uncultured Mucilaginibacter sp. TaxID=797541 RepID=UPI0025D8A6D8|nr:M15 family metallopeptidase [uncultured Mucilaginibacter sp.]